MKMNKHIITKELLVELKNSSSLFLITPTMTVLIIIFPILIENRFAVDEDLFIVSHLLFLIIFSTLFAIRKPIILERLIRELNFGNYKKLEFFNSKVVSEFIIFDRTFTVSMGAILYSGIYFSTDLLNEKYGKKEANRAVNLGFFANVAVLITLLLSLLFKPSDLTGSALEVHNALSVIASYSPAFIIGSLTAYFISQKFDVWFFNYLKTITDGKYLWLRNNLSTITSQLIDTFIYTFTWVIATDLGIYDAFYIALSKYIFKIFIALIDTVFIYGVRNLSPLVKNDE